MSNSRTSTGPDSEAFSPFLFLGTVFGSLAALVAAFRLVAPAAVWHAQVSAAAWKYGVLIAAVSVLNCFIEYFFHRYVLHKPVIAVLAQFYRQHTRHHSLTRIGVRATSKGREVPFIENIYPMVEPEQGEASFFPWYTLSVFALVITPLLVLGQWLAPSFPWFFSGYSALTFSLILYEVLHSIEHWPFETWSPLIEHARFGWFWRKIYSFHLRHHAVINCNEGISGFFTLPLADWLFGTCIIPATLYADGEEWSATKFEDPRPRAFIRWCDRTADSIVRRRRSRIRARKKVEASEIPDGTVAPAAACTRDALPS